MRLLDLPCCLKAVHLGHPHVHEDHLRAQRSAQLEGPLAVLGFAHHLEIRLACEHGPQTLPDERVIFGDQQPGPLGGGVYGHSLVPFPFCKVPCLGTSATTYAPSPGALLILRVPPRRPIRSCKSSMRRNALRNTRRSVKRKKAGPSKASSLHPGSEIHRRYSRREEALL